MPIAKHARHRGRASGADPFPAGWSLKRVRIILLLPALYQLSAALFNFLPPEHKLFLVHSGRPRLTESYLGDGYRDRTLAGSGAVAGKMSALRDSPGPTTG